MAEFKPIYTTCDSVKIRLTGKVTFESNDPAVARARSDRVMSNELLGQLIVDAETAVEQDLRGRYAIPFRSVKMKTWQGLPDHSRRAIRTIVDTKACLMILTDSFGSGTHITADGYTKNLEDQYQKLLRRLLGQDMEAEEFGEKRFRRTPPLDDLLLAPTNVADDGMRGMVLDANPRPYSGSDFAADQINDPSRNLTWFGGGYRGPR